MIFLLIFLINLTNLMSDSDVYHIHFFAVCRIRIGLLEIRQEVRVNRI